MSEIADVRSQLPSKISKSTAYLYVYLSSFVFTYVACRQTDVTSMTESTKYHRKRVCDITINSYVEQSTVT